MRTDDLDFELPAELIAQTPCPNREGSRLLHYRRADRSIRHHTFSDLPGLLRAGDLLVFNDTRVLPARFGLRKQTGGRVEGVFLLEPRPGRWRVMLKNLGNPGALLHFAEAPTIPVRVAETCGAGEYEIDVETDQPAIELLERIGRMPLPPYIKREKDHDERDELDRLRYQTVFARSPGAVAAPTASLHFSDTILNELAARGIERTFVTLHVGAGTFKPVTADTLEAHEMHREAYSIDATAAEALNGARGEKRRIVAVGTTSARALESQPSGQDFAAKSDGTGIFIYPPYDWRHVDALITNFHLPRSTLIALVAAMAGLEEQRRIYRTAIESRYRFFSYGDAMFIE
ncbi:MAG TPA: tRNA preQ1(34) S-adenosylmethionine ribosyltransferase-isomerase QueA [Tepidisphaeraceae bacterium]|nr:tRNA preQ1(34) S-adenosylmethionine ribosyltransferase-isomerase QueA [Tepidisphaeraceae bacterium]